MDGSPKPTIGRSFEIDQKAVARVLSWLPAGWLRRKQDPDVHLDYIVEVVENGEPSGRHFGMQVKGCERFRSLDKPPSHTFKTKHLRYYLEKCTIPVFLVVVDVSTGKGYWLFAQCILSTEAQRAKLRRHKNLTLSFNPDDDFENWSRFLLLLADAERYMRDMHPGTIDAAIRRKRDELQSKDPRLNVSISVDGNRERIHLTSKESFPIKMTLRAPNREALENKLREFIDHGAQTRIKSSDLTITGSPLLEEMLQQSSGEMVIQFGTDHPSSIDVIVEGNGPAAFFNIQGVLRIGRKLATFEGDWPSSPLRVSSPLSLEGEPSKTNVEFNFLLNNWMGQPVMGLEQFDRVEELMTTLAQAKGLTIRYFIRGNRAGEARTSISLPMDFDVRSAFDWIRKLRRVCAHFKINPILPDLTKIPDKEWLDVQDISDLLDGKEVRDRVPHLKLAFEVDKPIDEATLGRSPGFLRITGRTRTFCVFGHEVVLHLIEDTFSQVALVNVKALTTGGTALEMEGTEHSERFSVMTLAVGI